MPDKPPPPTADSTLRFVPTSRGFIRRTRLVNALLSSWPIVTGTGSWLEAHLVARLGMATPVPNVCGCGVNEQEVWDLVKQQRQLGKEPLVVMTDSIAADQGRKLMRRLMQGRKNQQILLLVEDDHWLSAEALAECRVQAIVHVESFGSGTLIRALQALRRRGNYLDPRLQKRLQKAAITLTGREQQVLEGLSRGLTNKAIAKETGIAATTVRDYLSQVSRKLGASNRTDALARAAALGLVRKRGDRRPA